jgi:transposase
MTSYVGLDVSLAETSVCVLGLETRHAHRALSARTNKTDRNDARGLAELMRVGWYREAWIRGASANAIRSLLLGRRLLHQTKRTLENTLRGGVKRFGLPFRTCPKSRHQAQGSRAYDDGFRARVYPLPTISG